MSPLMHVVGIDLSSRAIDLVKLEEDTNRAEWFRFELEGASAWERTRNVRGVLPGASWWDDVYLACVERPESRFHGVLHAYLPVLGAFVARVPSSVELWQFAPKEWRTACGLGGAASKNEVAQWAYDRWEPRGPADAFPTVVRPQDAYDAFCVAFAARELNRRGIEAA